jgi:hypothetical protein
VPPAGGRLQLFLRLCLLLGFKLSNWLRKRRHVELILLCALLAASLL